MPCGLFLRKAKMREALRASGNSWGGHLTRSLWAGLGLGLVFVLAPAPPGRSQIQSQLEPQASQQPYYTGRGGRDTSGDYDPIMMERRMNALNVARQKEMISDADKLLKLARELNDEIAAKGAASLTDDQLRRIAEIEKLAHSVKEKMADGVPQARQSFGPPVMFPDQ